MKYLFINVVAGVGSTGKIIAEAARELETPFYKIGKLAMRLWKPW